jgi:hypothetical protein
MTNQTSDMGGAGDSRPGADWRQIQNSARQLASDASTVRQQLQQAGIAGKDLAPVDDVLKALRELGNDKNLVNPKGLQELYSTAVDKFKALDFAIRKKVDTSNEQLLLSGSEDIPDSFKALIQEYYRALAKKGGKK